MTGYRSVQLAPDGDWIVDYREPTIAATIERVADQGSRWYFYPFAVVIRDQGPVTRGTARIVDASGLPPWWPSFRHRAIRTLARFLASMPEAEMADTVSCGW